MDNIVFKDKYSSLKIDSITVIKLKALAKQRGIKGYYKLRKAKLIKKFEAHADVNEQVLIPELETPRNTTRSVSSCAMPDDPILDDKTPVLQPTPSFSAKSIQKIKDFGNWLLDYIPPKPKVVDEDLESLKNLFKILYNKRDTSFQLKESKSALKKFAIQYRIDGKDGFNHDLFLVNAKQSITNLLINRRQYKVRFILSCMMEKVDLKSGEVIAKEAAFHSKTAVNLESTNSNELFLKMKETVLVFSKISETRK